MYRWPQVLHLCLDRPATLTGEEVFENGLEIDGVHYNFSGLIHKRREGAWDVSVRRRSGKCQQGWYSIKKNSKEKHSAEDAILSDIVIVQLSMVRSSPFMADDICDGREESMTRDAPQVIVVPFLYTC